VRTITNAVAAIAADATEREFGLWRAGSGDIDGMSAPASRILWRRLPDEAKESDTVDLIGLALAVAAYVGKNLALRTAVRKGVAAGDITPAGPKKQPGGGPVDFGDGLTGRFVPSGDPAADAAAAAAWGVPGYPAPAA